MNRLADPNDEETTEPRKHRIIVVDDDLSSRRLLELNLDNWGYETISVSNISRVFQIMQEQCPPSIFILDRAAHTVDCSNVCRRIRASNFKVRPYIIILTSKITGEDTPYGSGPYGDDYIKKPPDNEELRVRIEVGIRVMGLQAALSAQICDLHQTVDKIKKPNVLVSICSHCKKIRDDRGCWNELEQYISKHSDTQFSHVICPDCLNKFYPDVINERL